MHGVYAVKVFLKLNSHLSAHVWHWGSETVFVNLLRSPGIDSQPGGIDSWAPQMIIIRALATYAGGTDSLESIPGLLKVVQNRALPDFRFPLRMSSYCHQW
jgi:hypothetical protein